MNKILYIVSILGIIIVFAFSYSYPYSFSSNNNYSLLDRVLFSSDENTCFSSDDKLVDGGKGKSRP